MNRERKTELIKENRTSNQLNSKIFNLVQQKYPKKTYPNPEFRTWGSSYNTNFYSRDIAFLNEI